MLTHPSPSRSPLLRAPSLTCWCAAGFSCVCVCECVCVCVCVCVYQQMALKEAKSCRSYDTFELVAKSIPMPPYPYINDVLDPLVAARKEDHR